MQVNPLQLLTLASAMIKARLNLLVTGAPGIGKSDILAQATASAGARLLISHPAVSDPTDFKGLPWPEKSAKSAQFIPFGEFAEALESKEPLVWFFDDLGQASPAVQAACMQLFLARRINGHVLPDTVTFVAATNRRIDRAGVSGILEPVKSRFASIVELAPDLDAWCGWAYQNKISPTLIAFLRYREELLCKFEATADLTNSPMPRTWSHVSKLETLTLPPAIESAAMSGAVGDGPATEYLAFRKMATSLINIDAILLNPSGIKLPTKPDELYATVVGLASKTNVNTLDRVVTYCERLMDANKGEFSVLCIRDAVRRDANLTSTQTYTEKIACGRIGALIAGKAVN